MTFALGLAVVSFGRHVMESDVAVDLPEIRSDSVMVVTPIRRECMPYGISHFTYDWPNIRKCRKEVGYSRLHPTEPK